MKFDAGDTVLLLHSGEEGTIVEILDEETVSVRVKGVVFPVYIDQLDFPYFERFRKGGTGARKSAAVPGEYLPVEKPARPAREETGVFLSFLPEYEDAPDDAIVNMLKIHLLNETSLPYVFYYRLLLDGALELEVKNTVLPFAHFYLNDLLFEKFNDRPRFEFTFSPAEPDTGKAASYETVYKPKAKQIIQKLQSLQERQEATFSFLLFEKYPDRLPRDKEAWDLPAGPPETDYIRPADTALPSLPRYEIDLHIEKLTDHAEGLLPGDMLAMQLGELQRQLDRAIAHRQFSLVVIHGVGKGTLRNEVHEMLRHVPEVKSFINQYDIRYGYGATEVFFEYK